MKRFAVNFDQLFPSSFEEKNKLVFRSIAYDDGTLTPLIGTFHGKEYRCLLRLESIYGFLSRRGITIDMPKIKFTVARDIIGKLAKQKKYQGKRETLLTLNGDLYEAWTVEKIKIRDVYPRVDDNNRLTLDENKLIIAKIYDYVNPNEFHTFVREVWNSGKIILKWSEEIESESNPTSQPVRHQTQVEEVSISATYVLDNDGNIVIRDSENEYYVNDIIDQNGNRILVHNWMNGIDIAFDGKMQQAFPGAENVIWGTGKIFSNPLRDDQETNPYYKYEAYNPSIFSLFGRFNSNIVSYE